MKMRKKVKKILSSMVLFALLFNCLMVPINAKENQSDLIAVDYERGMEKFADISEEEWVNSATSNIRAVSNYNGGFIEVGNSKEGTGRLSELYNIHREGILNNGIKGISRIGAQNENILKEELSAEDKVNGQNELTAASEEIEVGLDKELSVEERQIDEILDKETSAGSEQNDKIVDKEIEDETELTDDTVDEESADGEERKDEVQGLEINDEEKQGEIVQGEKNVNEAQATGEGVQVLAAPSAGLEPFIRNVDSLRDGMITTETEIIWLFTGDAAIYYYGGFQSGYITIDAEDGFATKFYTPGTYNVLCYGENEDGEQSELVGFTVTVVPEFDCQTIEDSVTSVVDVKSYSIDIDFTGMDTAAVCLVRTGKSEVKMRVTDENGNTLMADSTGFRSPKRWIYIDKPNTDTEIGHYTVEVFATSYDASSGAFRVIIGNKDDAEAMMGGLENVVDLDMFFDDKDNYILSAYTPRDDEYWFTTNMPSPSTLTLLSHSAKLRIKLLDIDTLDVKFDSNDSTWNKMHSTKFTGQYSYAEKATFAALTGQRHYLVLYNSTPEEGTGVLEKEFRLGVGQPMYGLDHEEVFGSSVTLNASSYSSTSLNMNKDSVPTTAQMNEAYISGMQYTKLGRWRLRAPGQSSYRTSSTGDMYINYNFTPVGSLNTFAKGSWDMGIILKSGSSSMNYYPSVTFSYYYEYGDATITIVPRE
ncbi:MAG: hypothetical protein HDR18_12095 [Lachnospiraceae bacterium]|nr:hypothetical protein [Lachnospiraceae bacterium]